MNSTTRNKLGRAGFRIGSADEFLGLNEAESKLVAIRLALAEKLKTRRRELGLTQTDLARRLESSQSRIAKMEAGDSSVSVDLLMKAILTTGANTKEIGRVLAIA